jgi:hypothetical protein
MLPHLLVVIERIFCLNSARFHGRIPLTSRAPAVQRMKGNAMKRCLGESFLATLSLAVPPPRPSLPFAYVAVFSIYQSRFAHRTQVPIAPENISHPKISHILKLQA